MPNQQHRSTRKISTLKDDVKEALNSWGIPDPEDPQDVGLLPDPATHASTNGAPYQHLLKARDMQIWALRIRGYSAEQIAKHYDIKPAQVNNAIARASASVETELPNTVIKLELARLDYLLVKAMDVMEHRHAVFNHGQVMYDQKTDRPYVDTAPVLNAIDRCLKIQERRAKLMGLDKDPQSTPPDDDQLTPELTQMIENVNKQAEEFLQAHNATNNPTHNPTHQP